MGCIQAKNKSRSKSRVNQADKVIAELKMTRDKVKNYLKKLESLILSCKNCVTQCIRAKQKEKAMLALRKQKYLEKNLESGQKELLNLEGQILAIENAEMQKSVYDALKQGNEFLKALNKELTVEDVDKLMAETEDAIEYQQEVGRALAEQGIREDDRDLERELQELDEKEAKEYEIPSVGREEEREIQEKPKKKKKKHREVVEEVAS
jgi:charged multivesicular body protein 6